MARRLLSLSLLFSISSALTACSWFQEDDSFPAIAPAPAAGEAPLVTPAGQTPVAPGAAAAPAAGGNAYGAGAGAGAYATPAPATATAAPIANEQFVRHTIVSGDRLWNLARTYKTSVERIKTVNGLTSDKILLGQTIIIPTTSPPPGAELVTPPAVPATSTIPSTTPAPTTTTTSTLPPIPSALNPVVKPLPTPTTPATGPREPIAIPRPAN